MNEDEGRHRYVVVENPVEGLKATWPFPSSESDPPMATSCRFHSRLRFQRRSPFAAADVAPHNVLDFCKVLESEAGIARVMAGLCSVCISMSVYTVRL
jgi:hypothetical protein